MTDAVSLESGVVDMPPQQLPAGQIERPICLSTTLRRGQRHGETAKVRLTASTYIILHRFETISSAGLTHSLTGPLEFSCRHLNSENLDNPLTASLRLLRKAQRLIPPKNGSDPLSPRSSCC
jgi:hypothetical protein